jgi:hypothetical protein
LSKKQEEGGGGPQSDTENPIPEESGPLAQPMLDHGSMEKLKNWLLEDDESTESWIGNVADSIPGPGQTSRALNADVGSDLDLAVASDSALIEEINELRRQNAEMRERLDVAIEGLPKDQASILKKEMELMDLEETLREKERGIEESMSTLSNKEPGLEERFQEELREKEDEFRKREAEFNQRIEQIEKELQETESETRLR